MKTSDSDALIALRLAILILKKYPQQQDVAVTDDCLSVYSTLEERIANVLFDDILWGKIGYGHTTAEKIVSPMRAFLAFCDSDQEEDDLIFQFQLTNEECDAYAKHMKSTGISVDLDSMEAVGVEVESCLSNAATKLFSDLCKSKFMQVNGGAAFELASFMASTRDELFAQPENKEIAKLRFRPMTIPIAENEMALRTMAERVFADTTKTMKEGTYSNALKWKQQKEKMIDVIREKEKQLNDCWINRDAFTESHAGLLPVETLISMEHEHGVRIEDILWNETNGLQFLVRISPKTHRRSGRPPDIKYEKGQIIAGKKSVIVPAKWNVPVGLCKALLDATAYQKNPFEPVEIDNLYDYYGESDHLTWDDLTIDARKAFRVQLKNHIKRINECFEKNGLPQWISKDGNVVTRLF